MNFTTIEQSKALIEVGLNPDTADMCYMYTKFDGDPEPQYFASLSKAKTNDIPCWSTNALLNLMPPYLFEFSRGIDLNIYKNVSKGSWVISYLPNNVESMQKDKFRLFSFGDTLVDASCDMILKLLKDGFIKKVE